MTDPLFLKGYVPLFPFLPSLLTGRRSPLHPTTRFRKPIRSALRPPGFRQGPGKALSGLGWREGRRSWVLGMPAS